jgi:hypothetical protein
MSFHNPFKCTSCNWRGKYVVGIPSETSQGIFRCSQCFARVERNVCPDCKNLVPDCPTCQKDYEDYGIGCTARGQRLHTLKRLGDPSYEREVEAAKEGEKEGLEKYTPGEISP